MEDPGDDCLAWWAQEQDATLRQWQDSASSKNSYLQKEKIQQCYDDLHKLLQKIQGLPATVLRLPLELTVLYNMVIFHSNLTNGFTEKHGEQIDRGLVRVVEASREDTGDTWSSADLWRRIKFTGYSQELSPPLQRVAALQCALWLSQHQLQDIQDLLQLLTSIDVSSSLDGLNKQQKLLQLIKSWTAPEEQRDIPTAQTAQHTRDVLYTSAAFLQGIEAMEEGDYLGAIDLLREAAGSMCSIRVLSEVYTCMGCCFNKMEKPQMALQYWKQALQTDSRCLSALYQSSQAYRSMGRLDAELDALCLLYKSLDGPAQRDFPSETHFLIRTELILNTPKLTCSVRTPTVWEVKYLIARRCFKARRMEEAVEHYLDLLAVLQGETHQEGLLPSPAPLPRIPELFLETAASLLEESRYHDAITVCEEVICRTREVIPEIHSFHICLSERDKKTCMEEQLNCVLWASSAHLLKGHGHGLLGELKEAIEEFTRCINLLLKIQVNISGSEDVTADNSVRLFNKELTIRDALKVSAFLSRGRQFLQLGKHKEALLNVQLSSQMAPACPGAAWSMLNVLWKMDRKREAASLWKKVQSSRTSSDEEWKEITWDLPLYLTSYTKDVFPMEDPLVEDLQEYLHNDDMQTAADS